MGFPARHAANAKRLDSKLVLTASDKASLPLSGKHIVMLGTLGGMTREETREFVKALGGIVQDTIQPNTHYVVACQAPIDEVTAALPGQTSANDHQAAASTIRVLSQRQFRALLPAGKANTNW